jgi:hypothetical protein
MPPERLAIPLSHNPARQKLWRAVGFLLVLGAGLGIGAIIDQVAHFPVTRGWWPEAASTAMTVTKSPATLEHVETQLGSIQTLPGLPWSLTETLQRSQQGMTVYFDANSAVGLKLKGELEEQELAVLRAWDIVITKHGNHTLILPAGAAEPTHHKNSFHFWAFLPGVDGALAFKNANNQLQTAPFWVTGDQNLKIFVNMEAFAPRDTPPLGPDTDVIAFLSLDPAMSEQALANSIPGAFPGLRQLVDLGQRHGFELTLGQDTAGLAYFLSTQDENLSLEALGAIAEESLSLQHLSTTGSTNEIRSTQEITIDFHNVDGVHSATARDETGNIVRLNASANQLIISNRPAKIGLESANKSTSCLQNPVGFIKPSAIYASLPLGVLSEASLDSRIKIAQEIAFTKNWLKICW